MPVLTLTRQIHSFHFKNSHRRCSVKRVVLNVKYLTTLILKNICERLLLSFYLYIQIKNIETVTLGTLPLRESLSQNCFEIIGCKIDIFTCILNVLAKSQIECYLNGLWHRGFQQILWNSRSICFWDVIWSNLSHSVPEHRKGTLIKVSSVRALILLLTLYRLASTKRSYLLKQTYRFHLQVCLSMYDLLVDTSRWRIKSMHSIHEIQNMWENLHFDLLSSVRFKTTRLANFQRFSSQ